MLKRWGSLLGLIAIIAALALGYSFYGMDATSSPHSKTELSGSNTPPLPAWKAMSLKEFAVLSPSNQTVFRAEWQRLSGENNQLTDEEFTASRRLNGGVSLRQRAAQGDLIAAVSLLRFSQYCLGSLGSTVFLEQDAARGPVKTVVSDCLRYFGEDVTGKDALSLLAVGWYQLIARAGFEPAAVAYWRALEASDPISQKSAGTDSQTRADNISLATSLLTTAAANGDSQAVWLLMGAYQYGNLVAADPQKASFYARIAVTDPAQSEIPWLRKLAGIK